MTFPISVKTSGEITNTNQLLPGVELLGRGYDVRGLYADIEYVKSQPLFDFGVANTTCQVFNKIYSIPELIKDNLIHQPVSLYKMVSGKSIEEYRENLNENINIGGSYKFFSASLKNSFNSENITTIGHEYNTLRGIHQLWRISLPFTEYIKQYLRENVKNDLDNNEISAMNIFEKYGAFYLGEIIMGGRLDYNSATKSLKFHATRTTGQILTASFESGVLNASAGIDSDTKKEIDKFRQNSTINLKAIGGHPKTVASIAVNSVEQVPMWAESLLDYPTLVDFNKHSLRPIWELCSSSQRQNELKNAFAKYMEQSINIVIHKKLLEVNLKPNMEFIANDTGSLAACDISVFRPGLSDDWCWVGQYAQRDHSTPIGHSIAIKDKYDLGLLKAPVSYNKIWDNNLSVSFHHYSCWRPVAPVGYTPLGDIMRLRVGDNNPPNDDEIRALMCVHNSIISKIDSLGVLIWTDIGTGAYNDVNIFPINPSGNCIDSGTFAAFPKHYVFTEPDKNIIPLGCIDKEYVEFIG